MKKLYECIVRKHGEQRSFCVLADSREDARARALATVAEYDRQYEALQALAGKAEADL